MPCFDPKDVIFVTNKWDTICCDDDEDNEAERDRTWRSLKSELKKEWPKVQEGNIFKLNLKEVKNISYIRGVNKRLVHRHCKIHVTQSIQLFFPLVITTHNRSLTSISNFVVKYKKNKKVSQPGAARRLLFDVGNVMGIS